MVDEKCYTNATYRGSCALALIMFLAGMLIGRSVVNSNIIIVSRFHSNPLSLPLTILLCI